MAQLNIKNEGTYQAATTLARRTGESVARAVEVAGRERLERQATSEEKLAAVARIQDEVTAAFERAGMKKPVLSELADEMYDEWVCRVDRRHVGYLRDLGQGERGRRLRRCDRP